MPLRTEVSLLLLALTASSIGIFLWEWRRRRKIYVKVGSVKKLFIYPIKSLKGIEVDELKCTNYGVEYNGVKNRYFMLVDGKGVMVSQRIEPSLVLLATEIHGDKLIVRSPQAIHNPLEITMKDKISPGEKIGENKLFTDFVETVDCGDEAAKWFQDYLKRSDVRLVRRSSELADRKYASNDAFVAKLKKQYPVNLEDFAAFHVVSQSSLDFLNTKLEKEVSEHNFRPNILIEGAPPFDEDNWKYLKFSSGAEIIAKLPCGRCILTTNDPETGIKTDKEPLVSLRKFRMPKDRALSKILNFAPCFGINCFLESGGNVTVGDDVYAVIQKGLFKF